MQFAYVLASEDSPVNELLASFAKKMISEDIAVVGATQINTPRPKNHNCDMDISVLPDGNIIRISQDLGAHSQGCQLDTSAIEEAAALTTARIEGAELLIINKFGKYEADGHGFRDVIAQAVMNGIPVLVGTNSNNMEAFEAFSGGEAECLEPTLAALTSWVHDCLNKAA